MAKLSRLSIENISDSLVRARLYKEIREGQEDDEWPIYTIEPADELSPDFVAYKVYGTAELKWLILIASGLDDMRERMDSGLELRLPPVAWIRQKIKYYSSL